MTVEQKFLIALQKANDALLAAQASFQSEIDAAVMRITVRAITDSDYAAEIQLIKTAQAKLNVAM